MAKTKVTKDITTSVGTLSFPRIFRETAGKNDKGEIVYDLQFLIPKTDRNGVRDILRAIKEVGEAEWGANWRKVRTPLRDGDKEKDELTEDGQTTKGEKYPERLNHFFLNARSTKPIGVYDRQRNPIVEPSDVYGGCKVKIALSFFPYSTSGNHGVGAGLNGVQKISDGEAFGGGGKPAVESMFDMLDDDEDLDLDEDFDDEVDEEPEPAPKKRAAAKKAPAKKAPAKRKPKPEPVEEDDEDEIDDEDDDDLYEDLDDDV